MLLEVQKVLVNSGNSVQKRVVKIIQKSVSKQQPQPHSNINLLSLLNHLQLLTKLVAHNLSKISLVITKQLNPQLSTLQNLLNPLLLLNK
jgi:hypothetical protein